MSKIALDLTKYPALERLFIDDQKQFGDTITKLLQHVEKAQIHKKFEYAERVYKMNYLDMLGELSETFFDPSYIAEQHHNEAEKEGLKGLKEDLHPLAIFTNKAPVYNAKGENISPQEWMQLDKFDLKDWLYALFYGARFVSWQELAEYLTLGEFELIDVLKARNFKQLAHIQEQLQQQKDKGIPQGKLIAGTGRLELRGEN